MMSMFSCCLKKCWYIWQRTNRKESQKLRNSHRIENKSQAMMVSWKLSWATRGVTVSTSAFLACHQCCCAGSSLALGLEFSGFSMWHFLKLVARGFLRVLRLPPSPPPPLHRLMVQPVKSSSNKCNLNSVKLST